MNIDRLEYKAGYKYQLQTVFNCETGILGNFVVFGNFIRLDETGKLTIYPGYAWDGPSGPTIDTDNFMRGALVHDALYQLIEEDALPLSYRKVADRLLAAICKMDGMSAIRRWWVLAGVNNFGLRALESHNPVKYIPEKEDA